MFEFIAGLILGAVLGVVADRVWEAFESRPRFRLTFGTFHNRGDREGILYTVENTGKKEISPVELALFHPMRGTLCLFAAESEGGLQPCESKRFECTLKDPRWDPAPVLQWFKHARGKPLATVPFEGFLFRIQMRQSSRVLFESERVGNKLAAAIFRGVENGGLPAAIWDEALALHVDTSSWWTRRRYLRQQRRMSDAMIEAAHSRMTSKVR